MTSQCGSRRSSVPEFPGEGHLPARPVLSAGAAKVIGMRIEPATADKWADLEELFGPNGASSGCWCMYFRTTSQEYSEGCRNSGAINRRGLQARLDRDPPAGLLGYDEDDVPVGWCAVAPR